MQAAAEARVDQAAAQAAAAGTAPASLQDKGSAAYQAAVRIQACFRGYAVRKVRPCPASPCRLERIVQPCCWLRSLPRGCCSEQAAILMGSTVCGRAGYEDVPPGRQAQRAAVLSSHPARRGPQRCHCQASREGQAHGVSVPQHALHVWWSRGGAPRWSRCPAHSQRLPAKLICAIHAQL